jgi:O-antigen/teichoic acid export membrane protein
MGQIRKQTIISSGIIYIGFFVGFLNTYLFVRNGIFTPVQNGLIKLLNDLGNTFFSFASLGVVSYIYKFHPYYNDNLPKKKNDQFFWSLIVVIIGFIIVAAASIIFKPLVVVKYSARSPLLLEYYYYILLIAAGWLFYSVFEVFGWFAQKSIFTSFLRETGVRIFQLLVMLLFVFGWIKFDAFVGFYSLTYIVIAVVLLCVLLHYKDVHISMRISEVTRKYFKKAAGYSLFLYSTTIISALALYIDSIFIGSISKDGLKDVAVYTIAGFIANTIMVPQRSIVAATLPVLSRSWKDKNLKEIQRLYSRSSINLLIIALTVFFTIWLSLSDIFDVLKFDDAYKAGINSVLLLSIGRIIEAGTGINGQIITTSNHWRYEVFAGMVLLGLMMPLNYILIKKYGINGAAIANLISMTVYNCIRIIVIWKKFNMQPFSVKTIFAVVMPVALYFACFYLMGGLSGWIGIFVKSAVFLSVNTILVLALKLSPDITAVYKSGLARLKQLK